jgi:hypothetical protein
MGAGVAPRRSRPARKRRRAARGRPVARCMARGAALLRPPPARVRRTDHAPDRRGAVGDRSRGLPVRRTRAGTVAAVRVCRARHDGRRAVSGWFAHPETARRLGDAAWLARLIALAGRSPDRVALGPSARAPSSDSSTSIAPPTDAPRSRSWSRPSTVGPAWRQRRSGRWRRTRRSRASSRCSPGSRRATPRARHSCAARSSRRSPTPRRGGVRLPRPPRRRRPPGAAVGATAGLTARRARRQSPSSRG